MNRREPLLKRGETLCSTKLAVLYQNAAGDVKKWKYSHPYRGGKISMNLFVYSFFLKVGPALKPFVEAKIWTAKILRECCLLKNVVPLAVLSERQTMDKAISNTNIYIWG